MNETLLAFYMGYAFCQGVNVEHLLAQKELAVPYVVYWQSEEPTAVPYPAQTQAEAVARAVEERDRRSATVSGWSSGREGTIAQADATTLDVLMIEGWVPALSSPVEMFVYLRKNPFRLVRGFMWKAHPQARKDPKAFMDQFKRGMLSHPFGQKCVEYIDRGEVVQYAR